MKSARKNPVMILDYSRCLRVSREDEVWARPSQPYTCEPCLTSGEFSGKVRFDGQAVPLCLDHDPAVKMVPSKEAQHA